MPVNQPRRISAKLKPEAAPRRTQAQRSEAMRKRLLAATLASLAEDGYSGSTLSSIVRRAGVSRGAQVHHYPSKQALMLDATEQLLRRSYRTLGEVMLSIADEDNRLEALIEACWQQLFATPLYRAYLELLTESHRDPALGAALGKLLERVRSLFEPAIDHYFEPAPGARANLHGLFLQLSCMLGGLAAQAHLMADEAPIYAQLKQWLRQAQPLMRARRGVRTPPPRPHDWDR
jgi:AcrR family transcriptional regulator